MPNDDQIAEGSGLLRDGADTVDTVAPMESDGDERRRGNDMRTAKRRAILDNLLTKLDYVIYAQLAALYYMDSSFFLFLLRAITHFTFLTPKDAIYGEGPSPRNQPFVAAILSSNVLCILLHLINKRPQAGETMRGYLHGGIFVDLIGEKGPISITRLVLFDVATLLLQTIMFGIFIESHALKSSGDVSPSSALASSSTNESQPRFQDHDAEERGVHRNDAFPAPPPSSSSPTTGSSSEAIEMQPIRRRSTPPTAGATISAGRTGDDEEGDGERDHLLAEPPSLDSQTFSPNSHPLDAFYTGEYVIANVHLIDTIRNQLSRYGAGTSTSISTANGDAATTSSALSSSSDSSEPHPTITRYFYFPGGRMAIRMRARGEQN